VRTPGPTVTQVVTEVVTVTLAEALAKHEAAAMFREKASRDEVVAMLPKAMTTAMEPVVQVGHEQEPPQPRSQRPVPSPRTQSIVPSCQAITSLTAANQDHQAQRRNDLVSAPAPPPLTSLRTYSLGSPSIALCACAAVGDHVYGRTVAKMGEFHNASHGLRREWRCPALTDPPPPPLVHHPVFRVPHQQRRHEDFMSEAKRDRKVERPPGDEWFEWVMSHHGGWFPPQLAADRDDRIRNDMAQTVRGDRRGGGRLRAPGTDGTPLQCVRCVGAANGEPDD
jgi:hypothetical protein